MSRPKTSTKPSARTNRPINTLAAPVRKAGWPEVLTLAEAAAYLRVPEAEVVHMVSPPGLPGRLIGSEWRFSKTALDQWLRTPPAPSTKESLLALTGVWKDDPDVEEMLQEIYRQRGRPMKEVLHDAARHGHLDALAPHDQPRRATLDRLVYAATAGHIADALTQVPATVGGPIVRHLDRCSGAR